LGILLIYRELCWRTSVLSGMRCHVSGKFKDFSKEDDASLLWIEIPHMT